MRRIGREAEVAVALEAGFGVHAGGVVWADAADEALVDVDAKRPVCIDIRVAVRALADRRTRLAAACGTGAEVDNSLFGGVGLAPRPHDLQL